jgi:hypothetical protein
MSGFTDAFYAAATERLMATQIPGPKPYYNTGERWAYSSGVGCIVHEVSCCWAGATLYKSCHLLRTSLVWSLCDMQVLFMV